MHLKKLVVKNFRALEEIDIEFTAQVNVIVGPNAIGKTTVLEAIRLAKALLAPRSGNETNQVMMSLGAIPPHNPGQFIAEALARDPARPVEIRCRYSLTEEEITSLENSAQKIATNLVQSRMGQAFAIPSVLTAFLGTPQGKEILQGTETEINNAIKEIRQNTEKQCDLNAHVDFTSNRITTEDPLAAAFISSLDRRHSPDITSFSYFPADRSIPIGEQQVQLGAADAQQQIEAHNSQPQLKYSRLKNTIFGTEIKGDKEREELKDDFSRIFDGILKGRKLSSSGVNQYGMLTVQVEDTETKKIFSLDGMSSGEKGLILTFLMIGRSIADGGIILLDEPELHLNPAVCKDLLNFLVEGYVKRKNLQAIICSHSPEILAGAFDSESCALYHLVSEKMLTPLRSKDQDLISEALYRLGTSESEGLLYKATIFVEGEEDVELLEIGFSEMLRRYKVKDLGGRREIEKQIKILQEAEDKGAHQTLRYFIFDRDNSPSNLTSSKTVKILQWKRYCLENYLIDIDALTDLLMDHDITTKPIKNTGEVNKLIKGLALSQLDEYSARIVYNEFKYTNPGLRSKEIKGKNINEIAESLLSGLLELKGQISSLDESSWKDNFLKECTERKKGLLKTWEDRWEEECDGKRLFLDLQKNISLKISLSKFKKNVIEKMKNSTNKSQDWNLLENLIKNFIESTTT